jgi:hypothetical protein
MASVIVGNVGNVGNRHFRHSRRLSEMSEIPLGIRHLRQGVSDRSDR